jgi:Spy/CpxP family protein refolding chaperone
MDDFSKTLNLTSEQQEKVKKHQSTNMEKGAELRNKLRDKNSELKAELDKPQINRNRVNALVAEIKTLMGVQLEQRVDNIIFMKQILTPEQFKQMQEQINAKVKEMKKGIRAQGSP